MDPVPLYGAIGFHWKRGRHFVSVYVWRRGPWCISGCMQGRVFLLLSPRWSMLNTALSRGITDVLWGLKQKEP